MSTCGLRDFGRHTSNKIGHEYIHIEKSDTASATTHVIEVSSARRFKKLPREIGTTIIVRICFFTLYAGKNNWSTGDNYKLERSEKVSVVVAISQNRVSDADEDHPSPRGDAEEDPPKGSAAASASFITWRTESCGQQEHFQLHSQHCSLHQHVRLVLAVFPFPESVLLDRKHANQ